jgi:hypothetical protein
MEFTQVTEPSLVVAVLAITEAGWIAEIKVKP